MSDMATKMLATFAGDADAELLEQLRAVPDIPKPLATLPKGAQCAVLARMIELWGKHGEDPLPGYIQGFMDGLVMADGYVEEHGTILDQTVAPQATNGLAVNGNGVSRETALQESLMPETRVYP